MSLWLMRALLCQYVALAFFCWLEHRPWHALYWFGAACITTGLVGMR